MDNYFKLEDGIYIVRDLNAVLAILSDIGSYAPIDTKQLLGMDFSKGPIIVEFQKHAQSALGARLVSYSTSEYVARKQSRIDAVGQFLGQGPTPLEFRTVTTWPGGKVVGVQGLPQPTNGFDHTHLTIGAWVEWHQTPEGLQHQIHDSLSCNGYRFAVQSDLIVVVDIDKKPVDFFKARPITQVQEGEWTRLDFVKNPDKQTYFENGIETNNN